MKFEGNFPAYICVILGILKLYCLRILQSVGLVGGAVAVEHGTCAIG
jgi:hypothetical protein